MQFKKKHFFLLVLINLLLAILPGLFDPLQYFKSDAWLPSIIIVLVLSFLLFFIFWFFQYVFTKGKQPSVKFHLYSQLTITVFIIAAYGLIFFERFRHVEKGQTAEEHNRYFLETDLHDQYTTHRFDSLYREGFAELEKKMTGKNDAWLLRRVTRGTVHLTVNGQPGEVCVFYFTYNRNGTRTELVSKHAVGSNTNRLLFYDVPLASLPGLQALMRDKKTSKEESLSPDVIEKTYSEYKDPADSLVRK